MHAETTVPTDVVGLDELSQQIEQWRSRRPRTRPMPEELWQQAGEAARSLGVCRVSRALRLNYAALRRRVGTSSLPRTGAGRRRAPLPQSAEFVELSGFAAVKQAFIADEAVVEIAAPDGTRLTIRLKGSTNVVALVNALRWRA